MSEHAYVALRRLTLNGIELAVGDPISIGGVSRHRLKQLVEGRKVAWRLVDAKADGVLDATPEAVVDDGDAGVVPILHRSEVAAKRSGKRRVARRAD